MIVRKGWTLMATPEMQSRLDGLDADLAAIKKADPDGWTKNVKAKVIARIADVVFNEIPTNPSANEFRQGTTLGDSYKHWRRAKFLSRYRLFFRYDSKMKMVIYVWLNDENSLRKEGSKNDPYAIFAKRLKVGNPPNTWDELLKVAKPLKSSAKDG